MILKSPRGNNQILGEIQLTNSQDIPFLYEKSRKSFDSRKKTTLEERLLFVAKFLELYISKKQEIAKSISLEIGKPINQSLSDLDYDINYITRFSQNATKILADEIVFEDKNSKHILKYNPYGVMAVISPRNYPSSQRVRQIIPTIIAGNNVIYKCSSSCMRTANILNQMLESILPKYVFQYVYGDGDMGDILTNGDCDGVIFTGSTKVGQHISEIAAKDMKKTFFELGGSAPAIICESAKIDNGMIRSFDYYRRQHCGQICDGIKRVFVHKNKYYEFMNKMSKYINDKNIGNPLNTETDIGPLVSEKQKKILLEQIQDAKDKGAKVQEFGKFDNTNGPFVSPILITNITLDMRIMTEETFGPILPIYIFDNLDEATKIANSTNYGLGAYIWSDNDTDINKLIDGLCSGNICVNNTSYLIPQVPFGGYTSKSGNVRSNGYIGLRELCKIKVISIPK